MSWHQPARLLQGFSQDQSQQGQSQSIQNQSIQSQNISNQNIPNQNVQTHNNLPFNLVAQTGSSPSGVSSLAPSQGGVMGMAGHSSLFAFSPGTMAVAFPYQQSQQQAPHKQQHQQHQHQQQQPQQQSPQQQHAHHQPQPQHSQHHQHSHHHSQHPHHHHNPHNNHPHQPHSLARHSLPQLNQAAQNVQNVLSHDHHSLMRHPSLPSPQSFARASFSSPHDLQSLPPPLHAMSQPPQTDHRLAASECVISPESCSAASADTENDDGHGKSGSETLDAVMRVPPNRTGPTPKEWEHYKPILERLYVKEQYTLDDLMEYMETNYNFKASKRMYKRRIDKWLWFKYNSKRAQAAGVAVRVTRKTPQTRRGRVEAVAESLSPSEQPSQQSSPPSSSSSQQPPQQQTHRQQHRLQRQLSVQGAAQQRPAPPFQSYSNVEYRSSPAPSASWEHPSLTNSQSATPSPSPMTQSLPGGGPFPRSADASSAEYNPHAGISLFAPGETMQSRMVADLRGWGSQWDAHAAASAAATGAASSSALHRRQSDVRHQNNPSTDQYALPLPPAFTGFGCWNGVEIWSDDSEDEDIASVRARRPSNTVVALGLDTARSPVYIDDITPHISTRWHAAIKQESIEDFGQVYGY